MGERVQTSVFSEHAVVTDAHYEDLPDGRGELTSATESGSDLIMARFLSR